LSVTRASLAASVRKAVRPAGDSVVELLGVGRPTAAIAPPTVVTVEAATRFGPFRRPLAQVQRHSRVLSIAACLLLVGVAAVGSIAPVSAVGATSATPTGTSAAAGSGVTAGQGTDQTSADTGAGSDQGDSNIYNVIQTVAIAPGSSDYQIYVVRGGDTLSKIASRYGLSRNSVYWANPSRLPNPASISVGLKLLIPPADGITVTVRSNNTVSGFASKYKVSSQKIIAANGMSGPTLTVGQLLVIPVNPVPAIPAPKPATARSVKAWNGGKLRWPVPGYTRLSQGYWSGHRAIDIPAPTGTPVVAAYGGTVIFAGWKYSGSDGYGGGLVVWISHGGKLWTTYNHLSAEFVHLGQVVSAGQRIGSIGMTGNATGPHLHFEVWSCYPWTGGTTACARNPLSYL
jgi:murein DD-endopeptidase MepM/ murein hydrolase activator NlpD